MDSCGSFPDLSLRSALTVWFACSCFSAMDLSGSSKTMEQIQAIAIFLGAGAIASGIFFAVLKDRDSHATVRLGVILGVAVALADGTAGGLCCVDNIRAHSMGSGCQCSA